ncbi:hypothetical protein IPL68_05205 [Candidatus Saccharibacteria bacterium]|nr:MAG: hypothetical protein IPL68_05205 [Candidatus Saccharibacteria bacterium]
MLFKTTSDDVPLSLVTFPACMATVLGFKPEAIVLPANSAIPLSDSIRGFYETLSIEIPRIGFIRSDTSVSGFGVPPEVTQKRVDEEIPRLRTMLDGLKRVAILDHYTSSHYTSRLARTMLNLAGFENVLLCDGNVKWYAGIPPAAVAQLDVPRMTSPASKEFMYDLGVEAAKLAFEPAL